ncbi:hypothetical protein ABTF56_20430, partial [Acinetobacter baumannii]
MRSARLSASALALALASIFMPAAALAQFGPPPDRGFDRGNGFERRPGPDRGPGFDRGPGSDRGQGVDRGRERGRASGPDG